MKNIFALALVLLVAGCAGPKIDTNRAYVCTAGDVTYYADHFSAIIISDDEVIAGECVPNGLLISDLAD